jgi:phage portal protein BeeE
MPDLLSFLKEDRPQGTGQKASLAEALAGARSQTYYVDLGGDLYPTKSNADFAHNTSMIVYRASTYISDFITMIPWQIASRKTGEIVATNTDPNGHPLAVVITRQYRKSKQPFFALWSKALSLAGENYIEPVKLGGRYIGVDWLPPSLVEPYTMYGILQGFYYSAHGRQEFFHPHELVYDHLYNAVDENRGWSPVLANMTGINLDRDSRRAFQAWFRNGMLPPVIFGPGKEEGILEGSGLDKALDDLRAQLKEKHRGAGNAFRSLVVNWPIDVNTVPQPEINRNVDIMQFWKNDVAETFGLPPVVLGDPSSTPYKDAPEILAAAYTGAVRPQISRMEQSVNIELMPFFDDSEEFLFSFDKEKYEKLGENQKENADLQLQHYESGAISLQTYRQRIGATDDDETEGWETLPTMVKVPGIAAPIPLNELSTLWERLLQVAETKQTPGEGQGGPASAIESASPFGSSVQTPISTLDSAKAEFREEEHPRGEGGEFVERAGGNGDGEREENISPEHSGIPASDYPEHFLPKGEERTQSKAPEGSFDKRQEKEWLANMTKEESQSIEDWSTSHFNVFQDISSGELNIEDADSDIQEGYKAFETAFEAAPTYDGPHWRGASSRDDFETTLEMYESNLGGNITFDSYNSASAKYETAEGFSTLVAEEHGSPAVMFEMYGSQGKNIRNATAISREEEILLPPNAEYTIRDVYTKKDPNTDLDVIFVVMEDSG